VLRDGRELELEVKLLKPRALVPLHLNGKDPAYLVIAGTSVHDRLVCWPARLHAQVLLHITVPWAPPTS
jgi:hypothetical protein